MDRSEFEALVARLARDVPEQFKEKIVNVAFLVEDEPDEETLRENDVPPGALLGLYRGVPRTERGSEYGIGMTLPDTITLYRLPILEAAKAEGKSPADVARETVWHEIAHYFGMDEHGVNWREDEGTNRY